MIAAVWIFFSHISGKKYTIKCVEKAPFEVCTTLVQLLFMVPVLPAEGYTPSNML